MIVVLALALFVPVFGQILIMGTKQEDETKLKERLLSKDFTVAKSALEEVIKKKHAALTCLALGNSDWLIRSSAGKALRQLASDESVPCLIDALEKNQDIISGGSEALNSQEELNTDLVNALVRITQLPLEKKKKYEKFEIEMVIRESKQWCRLNRGKF
jgi:HEAT repeat protein